MLGKSTPKGQPGIGKDVFHDVECSPTAQENGLAVLPLHQGNRDNSEVCHCKSVRGGDFHQKIPGGAGIHHNQQAALPLNEVPRVERHSNLVRVKPKFIFAFF